MSHKVCWPSQRSPTGFATDGGFPFQMLVLSELFDSTRVLVPCASAGVHAGAIALTGHNLSICPMAVPAGDGLRRKLSMLIWTARSIRTISREIRAADAVHAPIPGDVGSIGMLLALVHRKPLFVRHCGNWFEPRTAAEHVWRWFMERAAGGRNVMLATGGGADPPSSNRSLRWVFSTSLTRTELGAWARERQWPSGAVKLLIACRQDKPKGTDIVIDSLPSIRAAFPGATLDVAGDGPMLPRLKALAQERGVAEHVTFHGRVDHDAVLRLMQAADLFCYPTSASEGFPKVVLEALACGLPVLTTRVSVLPHLFERGCGILLDSATPDTLASAVRLALADPDRYRAMSRAAVKTASAYSLEAWRDTIGDHLRTAWGPLRAA
ncbi:MAG: glycosyltransferase [Vicinamibacterales bacterium]